MSEFHRRGADDGFHVGYHRFVTHADYTEMTDALGFGDDQTEPAPTPAELLDPMRQAFSDAQEHFDCPEWCDECDQWEEPRSCEPCWGSGCGPGTALGAYDPCSECAGEGRAHRAYTPSGTWQHKPAAKPEEPA